MAKRTDGETFYWNDWLSSTDLRMCSPASRGIWFDMLCLMGLSTEFGKLLIAGKPPSTADLAKAISTPVALVLAALIELEKWNVYSKDRGGVIYCRRMIEATKVRKKCSKMGKIGGLVSYEKKRGIFAQSRTPSGIKTEGRPESLTLSTIPLKKKKGETCTNALPKNSTSETTTPPLRGDVLISNGHGEKFELTTTKPKAAKKATKPPPFRPPAWIPPETWAAFEKMRREIRAPLNETGRTRTIQKLERLKAQGFDPLECLGETIERCWRSVFAPSQDARPEAGSATSAVMAKIREAQEREEGENVH